MKFITMLIQLIRFVVLSTMTNNYVSTRIRAKANMAWSYDDNVALAAARANEIGSCLNPATIGVQAGWTKDDYMWVWTRVLTVMACMGKTFHYYTEDQIGSGGCRREHDLAITLGMRMVAHHTPPTTNNNHNYTTTNKGVAMDTLTMQIVDAHETELRRQTLELLGEIVLEKKETKHLITMEEVMNNMKDVTYTTNQEDAMDAEWKTSKVGGFDIVVHVRPAYVPLEEITIEEVQENLRIGTAEAVKTCALCGHIDDGACISCSLIGVVTDLQIREYHEEQDRLEGDAIEKSYRDLQANTAKDIERCANCNHIGEGDCTNCSLNWVSKFISVEVENYTAAELVD